jgi:hypothetical protein
MSAAVITLHPQMTATEIAQWCQEHRMFVTINYITGADGVLMPLITARREYDPDHVPAILRLQAD